MSRTTILSRAFGIMLVILGALLIVLRFSGLVVLTDDVWPEVVIGLVIILLGLVIAMRIFLLALEAIVVI